MKPYSPRVASALQLAMRLHQDQTRKGTDILYVTHLWAVASLVGQYGGDEDQVIAAMLHDVIEDQGKKISSEQIGQQFGPRVATIVDGGTETKAKGQIPWKQRKESYLAHLKTASSDIKLVAAADKLHNAMSIVNDLHEIGPLVWNRFNAGRDEQLWFYRALIEALGLVNHPLGNALHRTVEEMTRLATNDTHGNRAQSSL